MDTAVLVILSIFLVPGLLVGGAFLWAWFSRLRLKRKGVCLECHDLETHPLYELRQEKSRRLVESGKVDSTTGVAYDVYETDGLISGDIKELTCKTCGRVLWKRDWN